MVGNNREYIIVDTLRLLGHATLVHLHRHRDRVLDAELFGPFAFHFFRLSHVLTLPEFLVATGLAVAVCIRFVEQDPIVISAVLIKARHHTSTGQISQFKFAGIFNDDVGIIAG
jgi:hypothetical protein